MAMAMAAASLRSAASRIARSAAGQGRRLFYTRARALTADEKKDVAARLSNIQSKKEQLYDLIAECEKKYPKSAPHHVKLLQQISEQIDPRGGNALWRSCRRWALADYCKQLAGTILLTNLVANAMTYSYDKMYPREGKSSSNNKKTVLDGALKNVFPS